MLALMLRADSRRVLRTATIQDSEGDGLPDAIVPDPGECQAARPPPHPGAGRLGVAH